MKREASTQPRTPKWEDGVLGNVSHIVESMFVLVGLLVDDLRLSAAPGPCVQVEGTIRSLGDGTKAFPTTHFIKADSDFMINNMVRLLG
jgi:hypothetical protein